MSCKTWLSIHYIAHLPVCNSYLQMGCGLKASYFPNINSFSFSSCISLQYTVYVCFANKWLVNDTYTAYHKCQFFRAHNVKPLMQSFLKLDNAQNYTKFILLLLSCYSTLSRTESISDCNNYQKVPADL